MDGNLIASPAVPPSIASGEKLTPYERKNNDAAGGESIAKS